MKTQFLFYFLLQGPQGPPGGVGPVGSVGEKVKAHQIQTESFHLWIHMTQPSFDSRRIIMNRSYWISFVKWLLINIKGPISLRLSNIKVRDFFKSHHIYGDGLCVIWLSWVRLCVSFWKLTTFEVETDLSTLLLSDRRVNKARLETQELLENLEPG